MKSKFLLIVALTIPIVSCSQINDKHLITGTKTLPAGTQISSTETSTTMPEPIITSEPTPTEIECIVPDSDEDLLFIAYDGYLYKFIDGEYIQLTDEIRVRYYIGYLETKQELIVIDRDFLLYSINIDGKSIRQIYPDQITMDYPHISPDEGSILYSSSGSIRIYDFNTQKETEVIDTENDDKFPNWDPSGERIVFTSNYEEASHIFIFNLETGDLLEFTDGKHESITGPKWSPDGRYIAYTSQIQHRENNFISLYDTINHTSTRITDSTIENSGTYIWSMSGEELLFTVKTDMYYGYLYSINEGRQSLFPEGFDVFRHLRFSSDGKSFLFIGDIETARIGDQVFIGKYDGCPPTRLTTNEHGIAFYVYIE